MILILSFSSYDTHSLKAEELFLPPPEFEGFKIHLDNLFNIAGFCPVKVLKKAMRAFISL